MIIIKSQDEIKKMREGGRILADIMQKISDAVKPGITTSELNKLAEELIFKFGVKSSFKGYKSGGYENVYPAALCASVNEEIVHAIPSGRFLMEGDIISLDCGIWHKGLCTDMAVTVPVGKIDPETSRLIRVTKKALKRAFKKIRPGNTTGDIGNTVQRYVEDQGFNVVRNLVGHGVGREVHEDPAIPNFGKRRSGELLKTGMTIAIEPMVVMGDWKIDDCEDGFGVKTMDGALSAHFEHTVVVTESGCEVLTSIS
jgi:methionyl aminopeptidase